jgi:adenylylsulfate kinase
MHRETHARSILKAVSYRFFGTLVTAGIVFAMTGRFTAALFAGGADIALKVALFFLHERVWSRIRYGKTEAESVVVWFTGLSGSGKTTLAKRLVEEMRKGGLKVEYLDGDLMRQMLPDIGFSRQARNDHIRRVGLMASYLQKNGVSVVTAFISPYEESRKVARGFCSSFLEVYLATPVEECEKRDVKGLYARARKGEIKNFTGIDDPYEPPQQPEVSIDTSQVAVEEALELVHARVRALTDRAPGASHRG